MNCQSANTKGLLIFIGFLSSLAVLTSDMFLPAMPKIQKSFDTTSADVQFLVSIYMLGLALGQLIYGPLSDMIGRRKTLLFGLCLYTLGSLTCSLAPYISVLLTGRLLQALGACSAMTLWQPLIIDVFGKKDAFHKLALIYPIMGVSPAISPAIGGIIQTFSNWHVIFILFIVLGISLSISTHFLVTDRTVEKARSTGNYFHEVKNNYSIIITSGRFWCYASFGFLTYGAYYTYITASPFIFHHMGYPPHMIGLFYIPTTIAYIGGNFCCKKLAKYFNKNLLLGIGVIIFLCSAGMLMINTIYFQPQHAYQIIIPFSLLVLGNGFLIPIGMSTAIIIHEKISGTAAGMMGFSQAAMAFICSSLVASFTQVGVSSMSIVMAVMAACIAIAFLFLKVKKFKFI